MRGVTTRLGIDCNLHSLQSGTVLTFGGKHDNPRADKPNPVQTCWISNQDQDTVRFDLFVSFQLVLCYNWLRTYFLWSSAMFPSALWFWISISALPCTFSALVSVSVTACEHPSQLWYWSQRKVFLNRKCLSKDDRFVERHFRLEQTKLFYFYFFAPEHLWGRW